MAGNVMISQDMLKCGELYGEHVMRMEGEEKYVEAMTRLVFGKTSKPFRTVEEWWNAILEELKRRNSIERKHS
jgi:hypothetical protein